MVETASQHEAVLLSRSSSKNTVLSVCKNHLGPLSAVCCSRSNCQLPIKMPEPPCSKTETVCCRGPSSWERARMSDHHTSTINAAIHIVVGGSSASRDRIEIARIDHYSIMNTIATAAFKPVTSSVGAAPLHAVFRSRKEQQNCYDRNEQQNGKISK